MLTKMIEATNQTVGVNWGKFMVGRYDESEWRHRSHVDALGLIGSRGWSTDHLWVLDLQTGEGACFRPGGLARADLHKHRIWVCPMFEPFLEWLYKQDLTNLDDLPSLVDLDDPGSFSGYRRPGPKGDKTNAVRDKALPSRPDISTTGEDPYSVGFTVAAEDNRPWKKCCEECAFTDPMQRSMYLEIGERTDTHFHCVHREDDGKQRVCAGHAAFLLAKAIKQGEPCPDIR